MADSLCPTCGQALFDGLCVGCDVSEEEVEVEVDVVTDEDPLIGKVIADRYEIRALHGMGGMARIYRAVQRSLGREVVIKVISPELLAGDETTAEEAIARFMVEAQAASKLNHPNVVSVFDFGRTSKAEGGFLFLVMEYLTGKDLWAVHRESRAMPIARIANILKQVLAALGEAHYLGIAHRDIKPENIILEPTRGGRDLVKVIDFGLAKLGAVRSVTRVGQTVGTPSYMAPEQIAGSAIGSSDLYAVGVILFELLTGQLPFNGTPLQILRKHLADPRPDPRAVAPEREIPAALAGVCMRAMHIDPEQRWPDAEALSDAIVRAAGSAEWSSRATMPRFGSLTAGPDIRQIAEMGPPAELPHKPPAAPPPLPPKRNTESGPGCIAREDDLAWAAKLLTGSPNPPGLLLSIHGPAGVGRTRVLAEIALAAKKRKAHPIAVRAPPGPRREVTYGALRTIVAALAGVPEDDEKLTTSELAEGDPLAAAGLLAIYGGILQAPAETRQSAAAAVTWAAQQATARTGGTVILTVDDIDRIDSSSRAAVVDAMASSIPGFFVVATSVSPVQAPASRVAHRALAGLSFPDAARVMEQLGGAKDGPLARRTDGAIEPLYVELLRKWRVDGASSRAPPVLQDLVESFLTILPPAQRRLLLVVAVTGGGPLAEVAALARRDDAEQALGPLVDAGVLESGPGGVRVSHELFAKVAIATTPAGAVEEIHAAAAEKLSGDAISVELRAYHAVLGRPDFETFMLVEDTAALRVSTGDDDGAVDVLAAGMSAARTMLRHGDVEAGGSACVVFGKKLSVLLRRLGREEEAVLVLEESLAASGPDDAGRMRILEELARGCGALGRRADSERWRREALAIARKRDDRATVQRLVALARE